MRVTECHSYSSCPCLKCGDFCCLHMGDNVDTEKLCERAKRHCEKVHGKTGGNDD